MRLTTKRNGKNVIPLLMAVCGINLPYWRIDRPDDLHSYMSGDAADKLAAYEDAEEQGTLFSRWIPVTERLPLYGQDVLAVRTYGDGEKCQEVLMAHIAVWDEETGEKWWNATNITHWMPLPEPPKEET